MNFWLFQNIISYVLKNSSPRQPHDTKQISCQVGSSQSFYLARPSQTGCSFPVDGTVSGVHFWCCWDQTGSWGFSSKSSCSKSEGWTMFLLPSGSPEVRQQQWRQFCLLQTDSPKHFRTTMAQSAWHRQMLTVWEYQELGRPRQICIAKEAEAEAVCLFSKSSPSLKDLHLQSKCCRSGRCLVGKCFQGSAFMAQEWAQLPTRRILTWPCLEMWNTYSWMRLSSVILKNYVLRAPYLYPLYSYIS